jgi:hypothetical protein
VEGDLPPEPIRPAEFCRQFLNTLDASEGRRKKRKRDTTPDALGMQIKGELLRRAIDADPDPDDFEGWLLAQTLSAPAGGPVRAMCSEIFDNYRFARADPAYMRWLSDGAHSADAVPDDQG